MMTKNTICLWYAHDAEEAARFYAETFAHSQLGAIHRAPSDYPGGKAAKPAFEAMMPMTKIDVAAIEAAVRG